MAKREILRKKEGFLGTNHSLVPVAAQPEHVSAGGLEVEKEQEEFLGGFSDFLPEASEISPVKSIICVVQVVSRRERTKFLVIAFLILFIFSSRLVIRVEIYKFRAVAHHTSK